MNARNSVAAILVAGLVATNLHLPAQINAPAKSVDERIEALENEINQLKQQREAERAASEKLEQEIKLLKQQRESEKSASEQLGQDVQRLKQEHESAQAAEKKTKALPVVKAGAEGLSVKSADGEFDFQVHGLLQADAHYYANDQAGLGTDEFLLRKVRPILQGSVFTDFGFRFMPDFGQGSAVIQDIYVEWKRWPELRLRIGKFKTPAGLEALQADEATEFVERALPFDLLPFRDVGIQVSGDLWDGVVSYAGGVFNGVLDGASGDRDNGDDKDFAGRIFVHPFKKSDIAPLQGLGFGIAGIFGEPEGSPTDLNLPSYRTTGLLTFYKYITSTNAVFANGERVRWSPQVYYYWGPFGLMGEYAVSSQEVQRGAAGPTARLTHDAWQVAATFVVTGEKATYKGVTPEHPFLVNGVCGALELVARYSQLNIDGDAFPTFASPTSSARRANEWAVGLNWWLNKNIKVMLNYDHTDFDGGAATGDRPTEHAIFGRAQLAF